MLKHRESTAVWGDSGRVYKGKGYIRVLWIREVFVCCFKGFLGCYKGSVGLTRLMYVYIYICMYVCMYVCVYVCVYIYIYILQTIYSNK